MSKVVVVAPHPDDETLGCGGTILRHKADGNQVFWLIITNIDEVHGWDKEVVERRQKEIAEVADLYKFDKVIKLNFPTTTLDALPVSTLIQAVSEVFNEIKPELVYLPNRTDVHTDHQVTFQAVWSCAKFFRAPYVKRVLIYETVSETDFTPPSHEGIFSPNVFVDITPYFEKKLEIFQKYRSEVMDPPFSRSLESIGALAKVRGSRIGVCFAESFMLLEEIL
jgi:N-acetylglucosamine malate deacetylase 1